MHSHYRAADGALLVYDIANEVGFHISRRAATAMLRKLYSKLHRPRTENMSMQDACQRRSLYLTNQIVYERVLLHGKAGGIVNC
eukprot:1273497-Amphidinium_carterae.1